MALLTKLSKKDFEKLLSFYDIGDYKRHKHIDFALENTNYVIYTTKGKFIVKIFEVSDKKKVKYQLKVEERLHKERVKIPKIIITKKGEKFIILKNKPVTILEFVEGRHVRRLNKKLIINLAENIGKMHKNILKIMLVGKEDWPLADQLILHLKFKIENRYVLKEYNRLIDDLKLINYVSLRKSVIHGDLSYVNFLVRNNKLVAFIDWGDVHKDFLIYDLAILITHSFVNDTKIKNKELKLLMKHYQKHIRLNNEEKQALFLFIKVRLMSVILWHEAQKKKHPDKIRRIKRTIKKMVQMYKVIKKISPEQFIEIID